VKREFWLERWRTQQIGFHQPEVNGWLKKCWPDLGVPADAGVFVPLCGKSLDLHWLAARGHAVFGVELAESAVRDFFTEAGLPIRLDREPDLLRFSHDRITIYCGDVMELTVLHLRGVKAVYDRAALIALPPPMRLHYADHVQRIVPDGARMLLLTLEYDQSRIDGPPHSVPEAEVRALYDGRCEVEVLHRRVARELPPSFAAASVDDAVEVVYRIVKKR
jgi:thiopurine S-methyltransferase